MSILSGIKLVANSAAFGKLIGVAKKNGIKVFEKVDEYGCKHITSIGRDGNVRKKILKSPDIETVVDNFVTGERVNIRNGKTSFSITRRSKDGAIVERYFNAPWSNEVNLEFGEGKNMLKLSTWQNPSSKDVTFTMSNKNDFNLNGTLIPHGYTIASVNADGKTIGVLKEVIDDLPHDKELVQSVFSAVHKLLKI